MLILYIATMILWMININVCFDDFYLTKLSAFDNFHLTEL